MQYRESRQRVSNLDAGSAETRRGRFGRTTEPQTGEVKEVQSSVLSERPLTAGRAVVSSETPPVFTPISEVIASTEARIAAEEATALRDARQVQVAHLVDAGRISIDTLARNMHITPKAAEQYLDQIRRQQRYRVSHAARVPRRSMPDQTSVRVVQPAPEATASSKDTKSAIPPAESSTEAPLVPDGPQISDAARGKIESLRAANRTRFGAALDDCVTQLVTELPGSSAKHIADIVDVPVDTVQSHLRSMVREETMTASQVAEDGSYHFKYYPEGYDVPYPRTPHQEQAASSSYPTRNERTAAARAALPGFVADNPGLKDGEYAAMCGDVSSSTVQHMLSKLVSAGVLTKQRIGKNEVRYFPVAKPEPGE